MLRDAKHEALLMNRNDAASNTLRIIPAAPRRQSPIGRMFISF
jgi:hypothetical protein